MAESDPNTRLRVLALMLRYGHELFAADGLSAAATAAVNNAHEVLPFETATLFECTDGRVSVLAQYAQPVANVHSALAVEQTRLVKAWLADPEAKSDNPNERIVRLPLPQQARESKIDFVWYLNFAAEPPPAVEEIVKLLSAAAGNALSYHRLCRSRHAGLFRKIRKSTFWSFVAAMLAGSLFLRVPESVSTEFSVRAPKETSVYAWYDGAIEECPKKDGDRVKAGEVVVRYQVSQVKYRLALAKAQLAETQAELALARQNAFAHAEELGKAKLLEIRCKGLEVSVSEAEWYLEHADVRAPTDGVVALSEGDSERLENKAVRTGDELFRILGGKGHEAEILVNEREASVLREDLKVTLFLHTAPEKAISAHILEVSHYPQMTEQKTWSYRVRVALDESTIPDDLRYGMRGVAKLQSGDVSLGYRLFKSGVLYLRGL